MPSNAATSRRYSLPPFAMPNMSNMTGQEERLRDRSESRVGSRSSDIASVYRYRLGEYAFSGSGLFGSRFRVTCPVPAATNLSVETPADIGVIRRGPPWACAWTNGTAARNPRRLVPFTVTRRSPPSTPNRPRKRHDRHADSASNTELTGRSILAAISPIANFPEGSRYTG